MRSSYTSGDTVSLAGEWRFELDPTGVGVDQRWFERDLAETVVLPGTTNERGKAPPDEPCGARLGAGGSRDEVRPNGGLAATADARASDHLAERYPYEGAAWYQRSVTIPESWADRRVVLTLERTRATTLWVDDQRVGARRALSTPQRYDLTGAVDPGEHTLTLLVDTEAPPLSYPGVQRSHTASEHTQTNWNGVVGELELVATDPVWIDDLRVDPDPAAGVANLRATVCNRTEGTASCHLDLRARALEGNYSAPPETVTFEVADERTVVEVAYDLGPDPPLWDEFDPVRIGLTASLAATADGTEYTGGTTTTIGLRSVDTEGTQFTVNGRTTFLRGTVDSCVFPETGYPPTDRAAWREHFEAVREYGLNHVRFHSWCPPEAAFEAADELGLYLQPELPLWNNGGAFVDDDAAAFYRAEAERILEAYGNHPSFVTFALGNELSGDEAAMAEFVADLRERDGRRLYAAGAYNGLSGSTYSECDDFWTTASVPVGGSAAADPADPEDAPDPDDDPDLVRVRGTKGHIETTPPSTDHDYAAAVDAVAAPVVAHETGQFQVYPDFTELSKYDGALRPDNLELARSHLEAHGLLERAGEFARASGQLAVRCYREEVEAALRTEGFGGFELLALQDFPGQGTALVGLLDSFMDSKGLIDPEAWRSFCAPVVPLVEAPSRTWTTEETLSATVAVANYGPAGVSDAAAEWRFRVDGDIVDQGQFQPTDVPQGEVVDLGEVALSLGDVSAPARASVTADVPTLDANATTAMWVYPAAGRRVDVDDGVTVRRAFDERTRELLAAGEDVLLVPHHDRLAHSYPGQFQPSLWSYSLFKHKTPPGTLGPVFDPDHPALAEFPTADHADWQWWHLLRNARPVALDDAPDGYRPVVGMVDNVDRNRHLGLVFETAVGDGGLLVSTVDLFACADEPAGRQFYVSLARYLGSDAFDPAPSLRKPVLRRILPDETGDDPSDPTRETG